MGYGTAWGGHLPCKQVFRWVRFPYTPPVDFICLRKIIVFHHMIFYLYIEENYKENGYGKKTYARRI